MDSMIPYRPPTWSWPANLAQAEAMAVFITPRQMITPCVVARMYVSTYVCTVYVLEVSFMYSCLYMSMIIQALNLSPHQP